MTKKRVVAALALLLSMVIILPCLTGCDNAPKERNCPEMITYDDNFIRGRAYSYCPPRTLTLALRKGVDFECCVIGEPFIFENRQKTQTVKSGEGLLIAALLRYDVATDGYVTIIAKQSDHIVGYAVLLLKVNFTEDETSPNGWYVSTLKAVEFPRSFFSYQDITEEYVQEQFEELIKQ